MSFFIVVVVVDDDGDDEDDGDDASYEMKITYENGESKWNNQTFVMKQNDCVLQVALMQIDITHFVS